MKRSEIEILWLVFSGLKEHMLPPNFWVNHHPAFKYSFFFLSDDDFILNYLISFNTLLINGKHTYLLSQCMFLHNNNV